MPDLTGNARSFVKRVGRGIHRFGMIQAGDQILIGVSGGKDSLSLCVALQERMKWVPITYHLGAAVIEWKEYPFDPTEKEELLAYLQRLGIETRVISASISPPSFHGQLNCYLCSRNRKRLLFSEAQARGFTKVALGHTMDDVVETTLMNLFFGGEFATMMPVQSFFEGDLLVIRPMVEVTEKEVERFRKRIDLPVISSRCPHRLTNRRVLMKEIIGQLQRVNRKVRENIYRAPWKINWDYLPVSLSAEWNDHIEDTRLR